MQRETRIRMGILSLATSVAVALALISWLMPDILLQSVLIRIYALLSLLTLYAALVVEPLYSIAPGLQYRDETLAARRAFGIAALIFGMLHGSYSFWGRLGGFEGLPYLSRPYLVAVVLGVVTICILCGLVAAMGMWFGNMVSLRRRRVFNAVAYIAGVLILIHGSMLGTNLGNSHSILFAITAIGVAFLLLIESLRLESYLLRKGMTLYQARAVSLTFIAIVGILYSYMLSYAPNALSIHADHHG